MTPSTAFLAIALVLLITMAAGLVRVIIGPSPADRMMAAQLLGTSGIAVLLLLAATLGIPALIDVGLIFALLAAVSVAAFTRRRIGQDRS
ncbi:monovalent cation/H+ antiporter complex subunit F [Halochromatium glycolicum]|jgi:multicomponent Na+:H+ antiporter subunit F|uniref:Multiple resistance and pH regulation protein F n=1 Tax=Halochromatium glycolicum TaxID=85075 RepID=A0AAJ0U4Z8_9GAMM|nr:monovalent cation/H+ antiporter complex subunit F [Halochromatium glycolicum]MBK1704907.1 multiple resistance and pH regulation protein F [Halochromatium glycolicum]NBC49278.1 multiple resistance and pH regulation protein F [Gammaproteobacteria bacterium]